MAQQKIKDIPKEKVQDVVKSFEREGCSTQVVKQKNGLYTVIATCNDSNLIRNVNTIMCAVACWGQQIPGSRAFSPAIQGRILTRNRCAKYTSIACNCKKRVET